MTTNLNSVELLALSKHFADLAKSEAARENVTQGEHRVHSSFTVKMDGKVVVGEDELYQPTTAIPLKTTLALFVRYSGITGTAAMATLERAMKEAAEMDASVAKSLQEMADLAASEKKVAGMLGKLPKAQRAGKVKVAVNVDIEI